jgi:lipopolysaccharide export system permease protein
LKFLTATDRYIFRLVMLPLLATLAIAASLLLLEKMLNLFDFVAAEGGPVSVVWRMLANLVPEYLSLGIPIGLLLGILLAFRRLATSSELDIFRAVGMSYFRPLDLFNQARAICMKSCALNYVQVPLARKYGWGSLTMLAKT